MAGLPVGNTHIGGCCLLQSVFSKQCSARAYVPLTPLSLQEECRPHSIRLPLSRGLWVVRLSVSGCVSLAARGPRRPFPTSSSAKPLPPAAKPILVSRSNAISVPNMQQGDHSICGGKASPVHLWRGGTPFLQLAIYWV